MTEPGKLVSIVLAQGADTESPCMVAGTRVFTRRQVRNEVARCLMDLRSNGLGQGDRVLALLDHGPEAVFFLAAASALGLHLMMPYGLQAAALPEWLSIAENARPDVVIHQKRDRSGLDVLRDRCPSVVELPFPPGDSPDREVEIDYPAPIVNFLVLFTSGTTGRPKAISISEAHICARMASVTRMMGYSPDARIFMTGLMNNTTGVINSFGALLHDATVVFPEDPNPAHWHAQVAAHRATHLALRPVALKQFVAAVATGGHDLSCLRVVSYGGAAVPHAVLEQGRELIPCDWIQGYGLTETYGPFCFLDEAGHTDRRYAKHIYCIGRPDDTLEVRLVPVAGHPDGVGEILVRGAAVMEGYVDVADGTIQPPGEWLRTGDLAEWSPEGDLVLKGRSSGVLLSENGHRIYPEEIEAVLGGMQGVDEVVLVGLPGSRMPHERPVACLCGPIGAQSPDTVRSTVAGELERSLAREKWPDFVYATASPFPRSANGKIMRGEVAKGIDHAAVVELTGDGRD
ncbi:class I adenylate-forming enzyme family protein [Frankia sp. QA3]|uniref:class I adenylate-forming enzyme family protein n=1 Tax=Frankia sp. QA3 TaxID=710111 RepID=UPI000269C652|nr:long-chain fatty acid--CoA ligase [Frankia sp. QA3]EIV93555.1 acyl-CoA synthetase (AMP-forming)/AMP-acid ligase II [Frankia sp. QA3]